MSARRLSIEITITLQSAGTFLLDATGCAGDAASGDFVLGATGAEEAAAAGSTGNRTGWPCGSRRQHAHNTSSVATKRPRGSARARCIRDLRLDRDLQLLA